MSPYNCKPKNFLLLLLCLLFSLLKGNATIRYVKPIASGSGDGSSWANASSNLSAICLSAVSGDEIWIAGGTYFPAADLSGNTSPSDPRNKHFFIKAGVKLYGGFTGTETLLTQRIPGMNSTVLSGDIGISGNSSDNCYHVIIASSPNTTAGVTLDGLEIINANANGSNVTINGYTVYNDAGAGVFFDSGLNTLNNCILRNNKATAGGGAFFNQCPGSVSNCFFLNNTATLYGGGFFTIVGQSVNVYNCVFASNASLDKGGAIYNYASACVISNNTFYSNSASTDGGAVYWYSVSLANRFYNNTFWNNSKNNNTTVQGADYYRSSSSFSSVQFFNNLMQLTSENYTTTGTGFYDLGTSAANNKFNQDPLFTNAGSIHGIDGIFGTADDGLTAKACSPQFNAGGNSLVPPANTKDLAGNTRIQFTTVDAGAYEATSNPGGPDASLAASNTNKISVQAGTLTYSNDCSSLIATVTSSGANPISGTTIAWVWIEPTQPASFVKRHYEITPGNNWLLSTGRITLYFSQQDFTDFNAVNTLKLPIDAADIANNKSNLRIEKRTGGTSNGTGLPGSYTIYATTIDPADADIVWNNARSRWEVSFDVTGFSGFFVKTTTGLLPVNWISFGGSLNTNKQAVLNWKVEEHNVISYQVEKSPDGINFAQAGSINGMGDGNHSYSFTDATPLSGRAWYRIRQTDREGRFSYSSVIMLNPGNTETLSVYPNPFSDRIQIHSSKQQTLVLQDISGRALKSLTVNSGTSSISLEKLAKGIYFLKTTEGGNIKLVKN